MQPHLPAGLIDPPHEFSVMPFWFWNDALSEAEILRQIDDFERHGVYGFVIHPRVGLPRELGWMSPALLHFYRIAIDEARRRGMLVALYDEAMYPSGSSSGQVVAANPAYACRCLAKLDLAAGASPALQPGDTLVAVVPRADGSRMAVVDRPAGSIIRGIHYLGEGPAEDTPPAADLLNPDAVATFIRLVYDGFAAHFAADFGRTVFAIFTDEPSLLGRRPPKGVWPGTTGILRHINRLLGYDFTPHLPALWYDDEPDSARFRVDYRRALKLRLEEAYYGQLSAWCTAHGIALTGHPSESDDLGALRHFQIPGQDLVWRWVLPDQPSALEGAHATQAKCSSSAMLHANRRRNGNECCGAYGHELTWDEMQWLARWCFIRGVNLLFPHAFYYSVRGPRRDERPPDVGPHSPWWPRYREYADACRRLAWLNTDCTHVCDVALLGSSHGLPWRSAKVCFQYQRDFNYLEERDLLDRAVVDRDGLHIAGLHYRALIAEHSLSTAIARVLEPMATAGRLLELADRGAADAVPSFDAHLIRWLDRIAPAAYRIAPETKALRVRHIRKSGVHAFMLFNEEQAPCSVRIDLPVHGPRYVFDAVTAQIAPVADEAQLSLAGYELTVILVPESPVLANP